MQEGNTAENTAHRLEQLAELYRQGSVGDTVTKTLNKLFRYEAENCNAQIRELENDLSVFEKQYGMPSDLFYQQFQKGEVGDDMDFIEWASVIQMHQRLRQRLALLTSEPGEA